MQDGNSETQLYYTTMNKVNKGPLCILGCFTSPTKINVYSLTDALLAAMARLVNVTVTECHLDYSTSKASRIVILTSTVVVTPPESQ